MPETQIDREDTFHTLYIDIKANDQFSKDFSKLLQDAENNIVSHERKLSKKINEEISKRKRIYLEEWFYLNDSVDSNGYNILMSYLDAFVDDVEEKADRLAKRLDRINLNVDLTTRENLIDLLKYEKQLKAEKENLTKSYYQAVSFEDDNYYTYRLKLINHEAELYKKRLGDKFNAAKFVNTEMLKLGNEYEKFLSEKTKNQSNPSLKVNWSIPTSADNPNGSDIWRYDYFIPKQYPYSPNTKGLLRTEPVPPVPPVNLEHQSELIKDIIKNSVVASIGFENLSKALAQSLSLIRINLSENASAMEKIWGGMINSMIEDVAALVSKWLVMNTIAGIFGLGTGFGAVTFESLLGIPKLAGGGDFVVPPGFPNDSYPILVQSGERVRVTPSTSTAPETKLLSEIRDALYALNINSTSGTRQNPVTLKLFLDGRELAKSSDTILKKMNREGNVNTSLK